MGKQSETCETLLILRGNLANQSETVFHFENGKSPMKSSMFQMFHFFSAGKRRFEFSSPPRGLLERRPPSQVPPPPGCRMAVIAIEVDTSLPWL
jgi:hypothetical protein